VQKVNNAPKAPISLERQTLLTSSWTRFWPALKAEGDGAGLMRALLSAYQAPQRKYHTVQHLAECLALFERHMDLAQEPAEVAIALWFHDAVYDVRASDNEAQSARWAETELGRAGVAAPRIAHVAAHILATRHTAQPEGPDQALLVDIDLAILGAPRPRFEEYETQVRQEYAWVPEAIFRQKRRELLAGFLARPQIYHTPRLRDTFEQPARQNLITIVSP
jgi:predicted metal-dependent HD superfamily phosphohydrolase